MNLFSVRLKELRTSKNLTQLQMARQLGITERAYQRYEGKQLFYPRVESLIFLANFFEVSIDYLLGQTDNPKVNL